MSVAELHIAVEPVLGDTSVSTDVRPAANRWEHWSIFGLSVGLFVALGALLVFRYDSIAGDALSRVGNAYYVVFSRDPKLAAIGFVWTPLPSVVLLPFLPLKALWPGLVERGFVANIESAVCMALAAVLIDVSLEERGLSRTYRLSLVALFVLNPMTLSYAANGMSEAMLILFLVAATRWLARWLTEGTATNLARTGVYLALAYLARYEALAAGVAVTVLVGAISWYRVSGTRRERRHVAFADSALVGTPFLCAVAGFAIASWVIVGHPFDTFSSRYGNSAQVASAAHGIHAVHGSSAFSALSYVLRQTGLLAPGLAIVLPLTLLFLIRRRDLALFAPIVCLGSVLVFQQLAFARGSTFGWLRFEIPAIPMLVLLVGYLLSAPRRRLDPVSAAHVATRRFRGPAVLRGTLVAVVAVGLATSWIAMRDPTLGREENAQIVPVVQRLLGVAHSRDGALHNYEVERNVASTLDGMHLPNGTVLADAALAFPIILASRHPRQFVITSDRDFDAAVAYPAANGIRYILVASSPGGLDDISAHYPQLYANGAGIALLRREFSPTSSGSRTWRLYSVTDR